MKTFFSSYITLVFMVLSVVVQAQLVAVTGTVTSAKNGKAMKNVNIFDTLSNIGTITNDDGFFKLLLRQGKIDLSVTNGGFENIKQGFALKNDTVILVAMQPILSRKDKQKQDTEIQAAAETGNHGFLNWLSKNGQK